MTPKLVFSRAITYSFLECFLVAESWGEGNCSDKISSTNTSADPRLVGVTGIPACESWLTTSSTAFLVGVGAIVTSGSWSAVAEGDS